MGKTQLQPSLGSWLSKDLFFETLSTLCRSYKDHLIVFERFLFDACLLHNHGQNLFSVGTPREGRDSAQLVKSPIFQGPLHCNKD